MEKRVADIIMETLLENGIDTCFGVVGGGAMHLALVSVFPHRH